MTPVLRRSCLHMPLISGGFRGGAGGPWRGGNGFGPVLKGGPAGGGGIFWPVGQKFWARGEMKTYIRHCLLYLLCLRSYYVSYGSILTSLMSPSLTPLLPVTSPFLHLHKLCASESLTGEHVPLAVALLHGGEDDVGLAELLVVLQGEVHIVHRPQREQRLPPLRRRRCPEGARPVK